MAAADAPTTPRGTVTTSPGHLSAWGGAYDPIEHVPDLTWPTSVRTYARMRHDPTLASVLAAYTLPILKTSWHLDPRGAQSRTVRACADSLGLPILGRDDKPGPARRRGVRWLDHVRMALSCLAFGHSVFEPVYDVTSGTALLASLGERPQLSIAEWETDAQGDLVSLTQYGDVLKPNPTPIPADRLLVYVRQREGANWTGTSMLRPAFGAWLLKQDALRTQSTSLRRFGSGIPVVEWAPGTMPTEAQRVAADAVAANVRVGDGGGAQMPPGARLRIQGVEGAFPDGLPFIAYLDQQMARAALASMLDLGNTSNGSRALGQTFADLLQLAQQATADLIAETATDLCVRLTDYNLGVDAPAPAVVPGDLTVDEETLAASVAQLIAQGAITPDADTEAWLRDVYGAPAKKTEPNPAPVPPGPPTGPADPQGEPANPPTAQPPATGQTAAGRVCRHRVAAAAAGRDLTPAEAAAGLDPAALDQAHADVLTALTTAWTSVEADQHDSLTTQVAAAGSLAALAAITLATTDAADVLGAAMLEAADLGADLALTETTHQGHTLTAPTIDVAAVQDAADAIAAVMGQQTSAAAAREALRLAGDGATGEQVAAGVQTHLTSLTDSWTQAQLGGAVSQGLNTGRAAVLAQLADTPGIRWAASEVRDTATCPACLDVDGTVYDSWETAAAAYPTGGYRSCAGRLRCRGVLFSLAPGQSLEDARSGPLPVDVVSFEEYA